jgi:hypothetical protein
MLLKVETTFAQKKQDRISEMAYSLLPQETEDI